MRILIGVAVIQSALGAPSAEGALQSRASVEEAARQIESGELAAARATLEGILSAHPDDPAALHYLGGVLLDLGEIGAALPHLERASVLRPEPAAVHFNLGLAYERLGRASQASRAFQQAWEREPDNPIAALALGRTLIADDRPREAIAPLEKAAGLAPDAASPLFHLGFAQLRLGEAAAAVDALSQAAAIAGDDPQIHLFLALAAREAGRFDLAESSFRSVAEHARSTPEQRATALTDLGALAAVEGKNRQAAEWIGRALAIPNGLDGEPRRTAVRTRAESLIRGGLLEEAVAELTEAAKEPSDVDARLLLGRAFRLLAEHARSLHWYREAAAADPTLVEPWLRQAEVRLELHEVDAALRAAENARMRAPGDARAQYLLGRAHLAAGDVATAVAALEKAIELDPELEGALYSLGNALVRAGETARAREVLARFREIEQGRSAAYEAVGHLTTSNRQGLKLLREGRYDEAASWFRQIVADAPESLVGHLNLGIALLRAGKPTDALPSLESAKRLDADEAVVYRFLAQAYAALGREEEQRAAEEDYQRLRPHDDR